MALEDYRTLYAMYLSAFFLDRSLEELYFSRNVDSLVFVSFAFPDSDLAHRFLDWAAGSETASRNNDVRALIDYITERRISRRPPVEDGASSSPRGALAESAKLLLGGS